MKTMTFSLEEQVCCEICPAVPRGALKIVWKKETMFQRFTGFCSFFFFSFYLFLAPTPQPA